MNFFEHIKGMCDAFILYVKIYFCLLGEKINVFKIQQRLIDYNRKNFIYGERCKDLIKINIFLLNV